MPTSTHGAARVTWTAAASRAWPSGRTQLRFGRPDPPWVPADEEALVPQWSRKRQRQYEHIKESLVDSGRGEGLAEEIAARTVNKDRARAGEAEESSRTSTQDLSSARRGGLRSHRGAAGRTKAQLYAEARRKNVHGRSRMTKAELERAVDG